MVLVRLPGFERRWSARKLSFRASEIIFRIDPRYATVSSKSRVFTPYMGGVSPITPISCECSNQSAGLQQPRPRNILPAPMTEKTRPTAEACAGPAGDPGPHLLPPRSRRAAGLPADAGRPRQLPLHPRPLPRDVPQAALDHAPVRRLLQRRRVQPALPLPARAGHDRALGRLRPADPDRLRLRPRRWRAARSAASASRSTRIDDMRRLFDGIPLDRVTTSMTINATAPILLALYLVVAEEQGVAWEKVGGTVQNDILKEYAARGTYIYPPGAVAQAGHRRHRLLRRAGAEVEHDLDLRLPHARGRLDRGAGGRLHPRQRPRLRRGGARPRPRDRRLRAAPLVLLQRPQQLPRGGGEVPRRAPAVGRAGARALRAQGPALALAALPHPDRAARRSPRSSPTTTWCAWRSRRWPRSAAAPSRCTPTRRDEALGLPTEESARLALRTQQIIAHESGVADVADPLGGS